MDGLRQDGRNRPAGAIVLVAALGLALLIPTAARGEEAAAGERVRPRYQREGTRPDTGAAAPSVPLPDELIPQAPPPRQAVTREDRAPGTEGVSGEGRPGAGDDGTRRTVEAHGSSRRPVPLPPVRGETIEEYAARSAAWAAEQLARTAGWTEYYRIGAYEGLRRALNDPRIGRLDYRQGASLGRRDPQALTLGGRIGAGTADGLAMAAAEDQVSGQYRDLSRDPRYSPRAVIPAWSPGGSWAIEPDLRDVFDEYPPSGRFSADLTAAFRGWKYDPWALYRCGTWREFHDRDWSSPGRALDLFMGNRGLSARYRAMDRADRAVFEPAFRDELLRQLPRFFELQTRRGYERGVADGWSYGAFIRQEWQFRLGYNQGFDEGVVSSALAEFGNVYRRSYERHYALAFERWSSGPMPTVISMTLLDGNDDGIFEPGEEILADWEVANYGGREGRFTLAFEGRVLDRPVSLDVMLPARRVLTSRQPLRAVIDPGVPARTASQIFFTIADSVRSLDLVVSYPVEFDGNAALGRVETLSGRATLLTRVANRSRRDLTATLALEGSGPSGSMALPDGLFLRAGESRSVEVPLTGLSPLAMLAGDIRVGIGAGYGGEVHDRLAFAFPALARDLSRSDLLDYMLALARDANAPADQIAGARALLMDRLRADWREAVEGFGNPYRSDYADRGTETALGQLVRAWEREHRNMTNPAVFEGLEDEIRDLAEDLPGAHPFLRRDMKKLAGRLA